MGALAAFDDGAVRLLPAYLTYVDVWLSTAIEQATLQEILDARAVIAGLPISGASTSERHQLVARRAEYVLGKALRKGQAEGTITAKGYAGPLPSYVRNGRIVPGHPRDSAVLKDAVSAKSLVHNRKELHHIYLFASLEPDQFNAALEEARTEGNLARINVARKVLQRRHHGLESRSKRAEIIEDLAATGYTTMQMVDTLGVSVETVRRIARDFGIEVPADLITGKRRRIDYTAAVESAVTELDNWSGSLSFIDFDQVDTTGADEWVASLTESAAALRKFTEKIRKASHG